ncbi:hypothetical protein E2C01_066734 [Portunus trituberculatus]|uniref:Uncharacterized protein n=1 Tax=Portunus trituberculatus TaxID=210409 RepID=A0A5B7HRP0_PORTR|nr:hypothetical protein [Portunus trituberculatus]
MQSEVKYLLEERHMLPLVFTTGGDFAAHPAHIIATFTSRSTSTFKLHWQKGREVKVTLDGISQRGEKLHHIQVRVGSSRPDSGGIDCMHFFFIHSSLGII